MSQIITVPTRRALLGNGAKFTLSAVAVAMLGGREALAQGMSANASGDVQILNVALALEHEAIAAYQLGAESGLLQKPVMDVAVSFQSHHKAHRDALVATIEKLGGKPVMASSNAEYANALNAATLKSQGDVLALASRLELGAANAYLGVIPGFKDPALAKVAARLGADETMHWTALNGAMGKPLPMAALTFGA